MDEGYITLEADRVNKEQPSDFKDQETIKHNLGSQETLHTELHQDISSLTSVSSNSNDIDSKTIDILSQETKFIHPPTNDEDNKDDESSNLQNTTSLTVNDDLSDISSLTSDQSNSNISSSEDEKKKKDKLKKKKIKDLLKDVKNRLSTATEHNEHLENQFKEEQDAKERLESQLSKLQTKYQDQLKDEESLRSQLTNKDEYCTILERKNQGLETDFQNLKQDFDNKFLSRKSNDVDYDIKQKEISSDLQNENEELKQEILDMREKLESKENLIQQLESSSQRNRSDHSNDEDMTEDTNDDNKEERFTERSLVDQSELNSTIKTLENEISSLKKNLKEEQEKYSEVVEGLKEIEDTYGDKPIVIIEKYKKEVFHLQDRVRIAEESNNESIIRNQQQEVLDTQLLYERGKQNHLDELEGIRNELKEKNRIFENMKEENSVNTKLVSNTQEMLNNAQELSNERMQKIIELNTTIVSLNDTVKSKERIIEDRDDQIIRLQNQLSETAEMLTKEHNEKKNFRKELELMDSIQSKNKTMEVELDEFKHQMKLRGMKIKFIKKQMRDLNEQKQKAESVMFVLPEMHKKLENLEEEKVILQNEINQRNQQEENKRNQLEQEKQEEEKRLKLEKEEWELNVLGMGKCELYHEGEMQKNYDELEESLNRPHSAPPMKPRPPSAKRMPLNKNQLRFHSDRAPTLNPTFLNSYPEGRRASEKIRSRQERIMLPNRNQKKLYRSATEPVSFVNSYRHSSGRKHFPSIPKQHETLDRNTSPRVLVWGESEEGPGKKLVAVGDHVLAILKRNCALHGTCSNEYTGHIKFIGFIEGNNQDVYIGLRLDDEVGNTNGKIEERRYFRCESKRGKFVRLEDIVKVLESSEGLRHTPPLTL